MGVGANATRMGPWALTLSLCEVGGTPVNGTHNRVWWLGILSLRGTSKPALGLISIPSPREEEEEEKTLKHLPCVSSLEFIMHNP